MKKHTLKNPYITSPALPVDIVFHPSWWYKHTGITFDEDFYYHPFKRVEAERRMEKELYGRFGKWGLGQERDKDLPVAGAVHNAAGYLLSEMLGCRVEYKGDSAPQVVPVGMDELKADAEGAFRSKAFKRFENLLDGLKAKYGYITGDVNWGGVLNIAMDLAGENVFMDFYTNPEKTKEQFRAIACVIEKFVTGLSKETGSSSVSVNRNVRHIEKPVFLHSECSHTMIATEQYEEFLLSIDLEWSKKYRPFGIHYCGNDPHRYAASFAKIKNLDFLDVGWGGDVKELRKHLPHTFLNIRLDPVSISSYTNRELEKIIIQLVEDSGNPYLTGVCCINMDDKVEDSTINTIFMAVENLRERAQNGGKL
ncbi:MAG: hypothetical protein RBS73_00985 [Prolixibacteraceae bacterium]|jgi:hypothetical protein|nr:hypothetical protein [Prolixibacteraceae bacterium]